MALKKFNEAFYRPAAPLDSTTISRSAGQPPSGWNPLAADALFESSNIELDQADTTEIADGTTYTGSEKGEVNLSVIKHGNIADTYNTLRSALLNNHVDILLIDSNTPTEGHAILSLRLYPKLEVGDGEPKVICSGISEKSTRANTPPVVGVTIS